MFLAISLLDIKKYKNKILSWNYYGLPFAQVMASLLWAERDRSEKDFIMQPKKKKKNPQAFTVFWNLYFPLWDHPQIFQSRGLSLCSNCSLLFLWTCLTRENILNQEFEVQIRSCMYLVGCGRESRIWYW